MMKSTAERRTIEIAWAAHLDDCMDPNCPTCADYEAAIYRA